MTRRPRAPALAQSAASALIVDEQGGGSEALVHRLGRVPFSQSPPVVKRGVVVRRRTREAQP